MIVSLVLGKYLQDGLIVFLAWNMFLATLVYLLSTILAYLINKKAKLWMILVLLALWVLFFPNSLYMLTDFIHFQDSHYFIRYMDIYNYDLSEWWVFAHITIGALYAAKLGVESIKKLEPFAKKHMTKYYNYALTFLFLLSSFGIFVGRFLRFNSWNIFGLITQIDVIISYGAFFIGFLGIFIVVHWVTYFLFSNEKSNIYNIENKNVMEDKK
ncbi:MAG: DUF1361 domain-containing protein [Firmicutes bacterium]|nr:DUF1361 domain-containing protein [Bacillota bacterium]